MSSNRFVSVRIIIMIINNSFELLTVPELLLPSRNSLFLLEFVSPKTVILYIILLPIKEYLQLKLIIFLILRKSDSFSNYLGYFSLIFLGFFLKHLDPSKRDRKETCRFQTNTCRFFVYMTMITLFIVALTAATHKPFIIHLS